MSQNGLRERTQMWTIQQRTDEPLPLSVDVSVSLETCFRLFYCDPVVWKTVEIGYSVTRSTRGLIATVSLTL